MTHRHAASFLRMPVLCVLAISSCTDTSPELQCSKCEIHLEHEVTIGAKDGPGAITSWPTALAVGPERHIVVVAPYAGEERPREYDPSGRFIRRIGTVGEGPGEFERAEYAAFSGDSLLVYDRAQGRISVFGRDRTYARTIAGVPQLYRWVELSDGSLVANRTDYRLEPMVRLDRNGAVLASFGELYSGNDESAYLRPVRYLAASSSGGVWSAQLAFDYRIEKWSTTGELLQAIHLDQPWFPSYERAQNAAPEVPPQSTVQGIWEDPTGLLWIVGVTADPDYREGLGPSRRVEGHQVYEIIDPTLVYDAVIDVIDPGPPPRVVHHRQVPDHLFWVPEPGLLMSPKEDELGFVTIDLWRPRIPAADSEQRPNKR